MTIMTDLLLFGKDGFDVEKFINDACARKPENESMDRYLAELEMRLHLSAEDLDASLEDDCARALQRIPSAVQEVSHVKGDAGGLKMDVDRVLRKLEVSSSAAEQSVSLLRQIDLAKSRMEEACSVLKEATELAELFQKVDAVFASGNLQRISSLLATMRRSLTMVGDVPEFDGGIKKLGVLEARFQSILEPQLSAALQERQGDKVQQVATHLASINRAASIENLYVLSRTTALQQLWEGYDPSTSQVEFASWLPTFFDDLLGSVRVEAKWAASHLPEQFPQAVLQLVATLFSHIDKSFRSRTDAALDSGGEQGALSVLGKVQSCTADFAENLRHELSSAAAEDLALVLQAVFAVLEPIPGKRYGELELQHLRAEAASLEVPSTSESTETVVAGMKAVMPHVLQLCEAAVGRCMRLTQGTEMQALCIALDDTLETFVEKLKATLQELEESAKQAFGSNPSSSSDEASGMLALLNVAGTLQACMASVETLLRDNLAHIRVLLQIQALQQDLFSLVHVRLEKAEGRIRKELEKFVASAEEEHFSFLPTASAATAEFCNKVQQVIYDLLMLKLEAELAVVPQLASWQAAEPDSKYNLPSFSAYPQAYATAAGEYLMMLPQLLETLMASTGIEQESSVDADWLDKVAVGAADLYAAQLEQITSLSSQGSQQLAADLEYFCNVLSALGVSVPPTLGTWQVAAQWRSEEFSAAAQLAAEDGMVHIPTLQTVAQIRRLSLAFQE